MSKREEFIKIVAPDYIQPAAYRIIKEFLCSKGHTCSYCHGNGWFWNEVQGENIKKDCPVCHGSGELDAVVTIEWKPSKE